MGRAKRAGDAGGADHGRQSNYVKGLQRSSQKKKEPLSNRTRAQALAYLRGFFDALVRGGALSNNSAASAENYRLNAKLGHYKPLEPDEMGRFLDSIDGEKLCDHRTIIALMAYSCARVGAVVKMRLGSIYEQGRSPVRSPSMRNGATNTTSHATRSLRAI